MDKSSGGVGLTTSLASARTTPPTKAASALSGVELTRFRGHIILCVQEAANVQDQTAVPGGVQAADGRAGACRAHMLTGHLKWFENETGNRPPNRVNSTMSRPGGRVFREEVRQLHGGGACLVLQTHYSYCSE